MNCQPYETWLLDDTPLTAEERRELNAHLRNCPRCAAIFETGFALRAARAVPPAPGFVLRFEKRLAAQKAAERRMRIWGVALLALAGVGAFGWFAAPYVYALLFAPAQTLASLAASFALLVNFLYVTAEALSVFAKIIPNLLPPYAWMVFASALAGFCLLWAVSLWRVSRAPQGALA